MIIINTTFVIQTELCNEVLEWIKNVYLESALHRNALKDRTILVKVLVDSTPGTETYAIHIGFEDIEKAKKWGEGAGASLRRILAERWGEKVVTFHTYLEKIEL